MRSDSRPGKSRNLDGGEGAPVQWLSPADVRDEAALEPWRRAVGPPLTWSPPVSRGATGGGVGGEAGADRLLVGVWNLRVGGGDLDRFWDRIDSEADGAPVVLLLQEAFSAGDHVPPLATDFAHAGRIADEPSHGPRVDIAAFARRTRLHAFYVPSMRNGPGREDRGNAVLSTLALGGLRALELPFERQRRVAALATVRFSGLTLDVCSVHLDNRAPWSTAWRSLGSARARQMDGLLGRWAPGAPSVLGGDLNTWVRGVNEAAFRRARQAFPHPRRLDGRPTHHFELGGVLRRSDHLLFRLSEGWTATVVRLDDRFGSDHYPLLGRVTRDGAATPQV